MKINFQYKLILTIILFGIQFSFSQKKEENIGTEVVNVVKPYTPTISDAFKVKETPSLEDEDNTKKETIKYSIFSFPVASTFAPAKGKAAGVDKSKEEKLFKNYFTAGIGNYFTTFAELYVTENVGESDYIAGMVKHLASNGGIKNTPIDDKFLNSSIDLTYGSKQKEYSWNSDLGFQIQKYYWYGLPENYDSTLLPNEKADVINRLNDTGTQTYKNFYLGGRIHFTESIFNEISLKYDHFWDGYNSLENRFYVKPTFQFDVFEKTIKTEIIADYIGGNFRQGYNSILPIKYGYTNLGIHPSFAMKEEEWSFNIGASLFYSVDSENDSHQLFFYPQVTASLKVVGDLMVFYLGAEGDLHQNSFRDFTNENPFLSPTSGIAPTDRQFDIYAGLKGKLSNYISYNVRGSIINEKYKALFVSNDYHETILVQEPYKYGNSFGIIYDNMRTFGLFGELKADFSKNISFGINGNFNKYSTSNQQEAWNLPAIKFGANLDVNITQKWYAGADVFFVGERKDKQTNLDIMTLIATNNTKTLNSYFDANAHVGFKYSERLTAFLKLNNIANQSYEKWLHYPVQSFQVMLGASYKFDF